MCSVLHTMLIFLVNHLSPCILGFTKFFLLKGWWKGNSSILSFAKTQGTIYCPKKRYYIYVFIYIAGRFFVLFTRVSLYPSLLMFLKFWNFLVQNTKLWISISKTFKCKYVEHTYSFKWIDLRSVCFLVIKKKSHHYQLICSCLLHVTRRTNKPRHGPIVDSNQIKEQCQRILLEENQRSDTRHWNIGYVKAPESRNYYQFALCSAGLLSSSATVISSHTTPATSSSSSQPNSIFLSQHSSSSLQLQPAERGV